MPKFLIRWQNNAKFCPPTEEEREKLELALLEQDYGNLKAGYTKDWGRFLDRSGGYVISEAPNDEAIFASLQMFREKWGPIADFDVRQVTTIEEALESARQIVETRKKVTEKKE